MVGTWHSSLSTYWSYVDDASIPLLLDHHTRIRIPPASLASGHRGGVPVERQLLLYDVLTGMCGVAGMPGMFFRLTRKQEPPLGGWGGTRRAKRTPQSPQPRQVSKRAGRENLRLCLTDLCYDRVQRRVPRWLRRDNGSHGLNTPLISSYQGHMAYPSMGRCQRRQHNPGQRCRRSTGAFGGGHRR